jgi:hypothetical protein
MRYPVRDDEHSILGGRHFDLAQRGKTVGTNYIRPLLAQSGHRPFQITVGRLQVITEGWIKGQLAKTCGGYIL